MFKASPVRILNWVKEILYKKRVVIHNFNASSLAGLPWQVIGEICFLCLWLINIFLNQLNLVWLTFEKSCGWVVAGHSCRCKGRFSTLLDSLGLSIQGAAISYWGILLSLASWWIPLRVGRFIPCRSQHGFLFYFSSFFLPVTFLWTWDFNMTSSIFFFGCCL